MIFFAKLSPIEPEIPTKQNKNCIKYAPVRYGNQCYRAESMATSVIGNMEGQNTD